MEDGESGHDTRTPVPRPGDKGDSTMMSGDAGTMSGPQERGSDRDVEMEDGESCPEPKTTAPGFEGREISGGDGMINADADARTRTAQEPEDEGHSCRDGPEDQGDLGADVPMADAESSVACAPAVGNGPQNPTGPIETRFSHRLREAVTSPPASEPPAVPEDNRKTPAGSRRGKKKQATTRQKRVPSMPLGLWEIIDVDALVSWCSSMHLISPDFSFRKTETLLTSTSRNNH
jgi:hypothetical protein